MIYHMIDFNVADFLFLSWEGFVRLYCWEIENNTYSVLKTTFYQIFQSTDVQQHQWTEYMYCFVHAKKICQSHHVHFM